MKNLTERQVLLLKHMDMVDCDQAMEAFIAECNDIAFSEGKILNRTDINKELLQDYIYKYFENVREQCKILPKFNVPVLDIIVGMPGAGKSKIIKNNSYMKNSFNADADSIKNDLSELFDCNINSPCLHEISVIIRDEAMKIALEYKCNIVIEKVGKSEQSLIDLIENVGNDYLKNLRLIHCNTKISRIRNAMRFHKYNNIRTGVVARMIDDKFIKSIGTKPTELFFKIVNNEDMRKQFNICEAFIQESLFEDGKKIDLIPLYSESLQLDSKYDFIKKYISTRIKKEETIYKILYNIYSANSVDNSFKLLQIENGDLKLLDQEITNVAKKKGEEIL